MKPIILLLAVAVTLNSCEKSADSFDSTTVDYLAFGTSYGMCTGDCAKLFSISNKQLFPDNMNYYYSGQISFSSTPEPETKYQLAKELLENFPVYLINHADTTYGCPDCTDQGAIHLQLKQNNVVKTWHVDTNISKQPVEIRNYIARLHTILAQL